MSESLFKNLPNPIVLMMKVPLLTYGLYLSFFMFFYCSIRYEKVMHIHCLQVSISKYPNFINTEHYLFEMSALLLGLL